MPNKNKTCIQAIIKDIHNMMMQYRSLIQNNKLLQQSLMRLIDKLAVLGQDKASSFENIKADFNEILRLIQEDRDDCIRFSQESPDMDDAPGDKYNDMLSEFKQILKAFEQCV